MEIGLEERNALIEQYFKLGLQQSEILALLLCKDEICISEKTLKRVLKERGLSRRLNFSSDDAVKTFIKSEIETSSQLHGYKWMHLKCIQAGFVVKRETIRKILIELDPNGVATRTRNRLQRRVYYNKGPNFLFHLDAYDKLKPYGICIHGCIDGFSRHIMWLKAGTTSNDPRVVAGFFINTIEAIDGAPVRVRSDLGTENSSMEQMFIFLRNKENNPLEKVWLYGTSQHNQRIEAWWSILRKHQAQFWMNLFQNLKEEGLFDGTFLDKSLIQFCFMKIIQDELDTVAHEWNSHRISSSRNSVSPAGKPVILYNAPQIYSTKDYKKVVDKERLQTCKDECTFEVLPCDEDVFELSNLILEEKNILITGDPYEAVNVYEALRNEILSLLDSD